MTMLADDDAVTDLRRCASSAASPRRCRRCRPGASTTASAIAVLNSYGQTEIGGEIVGWNAADAREPTATTSSARSAGRTTASSCASPTRRRRREPASCRCCTPALSAGYADGADLADRLTADGWFRTGDLGRIDADGFVWIEGRVSDMINRGGLKVFPAEVEEVLLPSPGVRRRGRRRACPTTGSARCRGRSSCRAGGVAPSSDGLSDYCRAHLAPYKVPVRFEPVDALPRNEVGKVLKTELQAVLKGSRS